MTDYTVRPSEEVLTQHANNHPCGPNAKSIEVPCPCGGCVALVCRECREPVFVAVAPERIVNGGPCEHALELMP